MLTTRFDWHRKQPCRNRGGSREYRFNAVNKSHVFIHDGTPLIFLDSSSTTPLDLSVLEAMLPYLQANGTDGRQLSQEERSGRGIAIRKARESVAELLNCLPNEVIWTSGATEANNLAILGTAAKWDKPGRIISQVTEHASVLEPLRHLELLGWEVELLPVNEGGRVSIEDFRNALTKDTRLVSMMWGNNEIGTVHPIAEIADMCADRSIAFHCDASQSVGKVPVDLSEIPITMLTLSAHKFYGPVGAGALFIRDITRQISISPLMFGGGQEHGLRPGTLNVPAIVGMGTACELVKSHLKQWAAHTTTLRSRFEGRLMRELSEVSINGDTENRLPHISNISLFGTDNEGLLAMLPEIVASTGSACHFADFAPSHVLTALNKTPQVTDCSLRFGFTKANTEEEIDSAAKMLVQAVNEFRANA
jgi:cysteine desulfurase